MSASRVNRKMIVLFIVVIVVLMIATLIARVNYKRNQDIYKLSSDLQIHGLILKKPRTINNFELVGQDDKAFDKGDLLGHWTLMFFGFTHCHSVCPTTLSALSQMMRQLKATLPARLIPTVIMVSVDPGRDSVTGINKYVKSFDANFIGLRGNASNLTQLTRQLDVSFVKAGENNDDYVMNHSNEIMVLDPNGNLRAFFSYPHKGKTLAHDYELMVKSIKVEH